MRNKRLRHILRKLGLDREMNEKLNIVKETYKRRTESVPFADAMELDDFLYLLELAEYGYPLGKSSAIKYAFGLGYMAGKWGDEA